MFSAFLVSKSTSLSIIMGFRIYFSLSASAAPGNASVS